MTTLNRALTRFFRRHPNLQKQQTSVVAVSGGRDSICLLHWLTHSSVVTSKIIAVTIDHGLRPESTAECEQVKRMANRWGAECLIRQTLLTAATFTENSGRIARYNILQDAARQAGAKFILTGHHAGDQAESLLLHLLRGSGMTGLTGMQPQTELTSDGQTFVLVRPMLNVTPAIIKAYAAEHNLNVVDDSSNYDEKYTRNRIRHTLIPLIEERFNPQIQKNLSQTAAILHDDFAALEELHLSRWDEAEHDQGIGWGTFAFAHWQSGNPSFQRFALRKLYSQAHGSLQDLTQENLESARLGLSQQKTDKRYQLSGTVWVQKAYDTLLAYHKSAAEIFDMPQLADSAAEIAIETGQPNEIKLKNNQWKLLVQPIKLSDVNLEETADNRWVTFLTLKEPSSALILRGRRQSEAFRPFRMNGDVYLKKLMIDRKIPAILRDRWPLIADDTGILWVAGHRLAERAAITPQTQHAVKIIFKKVAV